VVRRLLLKREEAFAMRNREVAAREKERRKAWNVRFGRGLMALRAKRGMTRKGLAERLGVPYHRLNHWEQGHCQPPLIQMMALSEILEVTFLELGTAGELKSQTPLRSQEGPESSERRCAVSMETAG
jgi:transcriptional regulator with XRE-family HTH domain